MTGARSKTKGEVSALEMLQKSLDQGDIEGVRHRLTELDAKERNRLRLELGDDQFKLVYRPIQRK